MRISDWSSDVCSSDLGIDDRVGAGFAEIGFLPGTRVRSVGSAGDGVGEMGRDFIVAELVGGAADARDHSRIVEFDAVDDIGHGIEGAELQHGVRSEEHTSELQSLMRISYAVFCLKK